MSVESFIEQWQICIGLKLLNSKRVLLKFEDTLPDPGLDVLDFAFNFEQNLNRFISCSPTQEDYELSINDNSFLEKDDYPELSGINDPIISQAIGKNLTRVELFGYPELNQVTAVALYFDAYCFIVGSGIFSWNEKSNITEFLGFHGDDLFIWLPDQFAEIIRKKPIKMLKAIVTNFHSV